MTINDIFIAYSYHQITDEELYFADGDIPVYTGNNEIKGYWNNTFVENIQDILPCIAFPLKGNNSGFSSIIKSPFDANNTGLLVPRSEYKSKVNLEWFVYKLRSILIKIQTNKEGVSFINKDILETVEIELPKKSIQDKELKYFNRLDLIRKQYQSKFEKCSTLLSKNIYFNSKLDQVQINTILSYISRNDSLSEEGLYNIEKTNSSTNIKVLSGSIDNIYYGEIPLQTEGIHYLDNKQGLHIVTRGKAGKMTYISKGRYATNTNAFILYIIDGVKEEIGIKNENDETIYLKFLKIFLEPIFLDISSNSDVSVFPLSKVFTEMLIPKLVLNEEMRDVVKKFESLLHITEFLNNQIDKIDKLLEKEVK